MTQVSIIEYLNVRIRHLHSRLFSHSSYEDLLSGENLGTLTTFLLDHPDYSKDIEQALESLPEREGLERGVTNHFSRSISNTLNMAGGAPRRLFETALFSFDIKNVKTILLARARKITTRRAMDMLIPCSSFTEQMMRELLQSRNTSEVGYTIARCFPFGLGNIEDVLESAGKGVPLVSQLNRIEKSAYHGMLVMLDDSNHDRKILRSIFRYEIDMKNIAAALKSVWQGGMPDSNNEDPFIPDGFINEQFLHEMAKAQELDEAFEMVESTQFHTAVEKGIIYFAETGFLHEMERFFEEVFIRKILSFRRFDPFGIGVFIGYVWGKYVEMTNLRTIINGIAFRLGSAQIRKGLIYV